VLSIGGTDICKPLGTNLVCAIGSSAELGSKPVAHGVFASAVGGFIAG
jgi:hypothetical protein